MSYLRSLTRQHPADTTKTLGALRDRGLLEMIGSGRTARYVLGPKSGPESVAVESELLGSDVEPKSSGVKPISSAAKHGSPKGQSGSSDTEASMVGGRGSSLTTEGSSRTPRDVEDQPKSSKAQSKSSGLEPKSSRAESKSSGIPATEIDMSWDALLDMARPIRERTVRSTASRDLTIVELCANVPLTAAQIGALIGRNPAYVA